VVVKAHLDSITKGPPIKTDRESLDKLATDMANCHITLVQWGYDSELNLSQTLLDVFKRLPVHLMRKCSDKVNVYSIGYAATFSQLLSFVEDAADRAKSLFGQALAQPARYNLSCPRKLKSGQVFSAQSKTVDKRHWHCQRNPRDVCPSCNCNNHTLSKCQKFLRKPIHEHWHFVKGKRLCFNCLGVDHMSRYCKCESMALKRIHSLKRKLERNASLFALYQNSMDALLRDRYARKIPAGDARPRDKEHGMSIE